MCKITLKINSKVEVMAKTIEITQEELLLIRAAIGTWASNTKKDHAFDFEIEALESLKSKGVILNYEFEK